MAFLRLVRPGRHPRDHRTGRTITGWWPEIEAFLTLGITNAATEGTNRVIKQVKRNAYGFRNKTHYRNRVRLHCTRPTRRPVSARNGDLPAQS